jgi:hypothetical protein
MADRRKSITLADGGASSWVVRPDNSSPSARKLFHMSSEIRIVALSGVWANCRT